MPSNPARGGSQHGGGAAPRPRTATRWRPRVTPHQQRGAWPSDRGGVVYANEGAWLVHRGLALRPAPPRGPRGAGLPLCVPACRSQARRGTAAGASRRGGRCPVLWRRRRRRRRGAGPGGAAAAMPLFAANPFEQDVGERAPGRRGEAVGGTGSSRPRPRGGARPGGGGRWAPGRCLSPAARRCAAF